MSFFNFGFGKHFIPARSEPQTVSAQGVWDALGLFDAETVARIKAILMAVEPEKVQQVLDMVRDGKITIEISIK